MWKDGSTGRGLLALSQTIAFSLRSARLSTKKPEVSGIFGFYFLKWFGWRASTAARVSSARPSRPSYRGPAGQDRRRMEERDPLFCFLR
jgi:hypothetical protein